MKKLFFTIILLTIAVIKSAEQHPWASHVTIGNTYKDDWIILSKTTETLKITACYSPSRRMYDTTINGKSMFGIRNKAKLLFNTLYNEYTEQEK